jgi:hypothetical protein
MVPYYGDFAVNSTVYIPINTFDSNDPAASVTVTNLLNTDVHIHKNGGTTQRNNAAGITMAIDYDSITGNHLLSIDTSDNTVADFFQAGNEYQVRVEGITVDGGTINAWVGSFSLERSGGALALLKHATYGLSAIETLVDDLESRLTAARAGYLDNLNGHTAQTGDSYAIVNHGTYGNSAIKTETAAILEDTAAIPAASAIADAVWDEAISGHLGAGTTGNALNAAGSAGDPWSTPLPGSYGAGTAGLLLGTTIPNAIDAVDNYIDTEIGTLTTELAKVPKSDGSASWNATALAAIQGECTDALNAYDPPTKTEMDTAIGDVPTAAEIKTAIEAAGSHLALILEDTGTTLDTLIKDVPTTAEFEARTIVAANYATATSQTTIIADTNELQTDLTNGGRLDLLFDGIKSQTDKLTFTSGNDLDCNVQKINDVTITGDGSATPFGVA